jgi:hypothetical protein
VARFVATVCPMLTLPPGCSSPAGPSTSICATSSPSSASARGPSSSGSCWNCRR